MAFFLVSIFTITLTLNLSQRQTNTNTQAVDLCNTADSEFRCDQMPSCNWVPGKIACSTIEAPNNPVDNLWCTVKKGCSLVPKDRCEFRSDPNHGLLCKNQTTENACNTYNAICKWTAYNVGVCNYRSDPTNMSLCYSKTTRSACNSVNQACIWLSACEGEYDDPDPLNGSCRLAPSPTQGPGGGATATPTPGIPGHSTTACQCGVAPFLGNDNDDDQSNNSNFCNGYGSPVNNTRNTCIEANDGPDGFCDRDSNGLVDGEGETYDGHTGWTLGAIEYANKCGSGGNPTNTPAPPPPGSSPTPTLAPTPETIYPEANLTHNCSASQDLWPAYDFHLTSINNITQFWKATFSFCLHPIGVYSPDLNVYNIDHTYLFMNFFESKATWISEQKIKKNVEGNEVDLPIWACYNLGGYTEIPGEPGTNFINHFINGNSYLGSTKTRSDGTIYWPNIRELAEFTNNAIAEEKMSQFTEFIPKVVLAGFNGTDWRVNDQTILSRDTDGKGHMQLHTGLGTCAPDVTNAPTPTPVPTCEYVTVNVPYSRYIADKPGHTVVNQRYELDDTNLPQLDRTQPLKIGVDWGWTGTDEEFGPLNLPDGTIEDAGPNWQSNEESKVEIQGLNAESISLRNYTPINCPDVGEIKRDAHTLFSDGRAFWFIQDLLNINLRDVSLPDENLRGNWYTCPITASAEPQLSKFTDTEQIRPDNEWLDIPFTDDLAKLRFTKSFTGNDTSTGSHFTRILVRYCKTNIEPTLTVTPTP